MGQCSGRHRLVGLFAAAALLTPLLVAVASSVSHAVTVPVPADPPRTATAVVTEYPPPYAGAAWTTVATGIGAPLALALAPVTGTATALGP